MTTLSDRNLSYQEVEQRVAGFYPPQETPVEILRRGYVGVAPGAGTYPEPISDLGKLLRSKLDAPLKASDRQVAGDHYKKMGIQTWDVVDTWPREQKIGYYRGGALKYLMRMGSKDENAQEIAKGQHYLEKLLEVLKDVQ